MTRGSKGGAGDGGSDTNCWDSQARVFGIWRRKKRRGRELLRKKRERRDGNFAGKSPNFLFSHNLLGLLQIY